MDILLRAEAVARLRDASRRVTEVAADYLIEEHIEADQKPDPARVQRILSKRGVHVSYGRLVDKLKAIRFRFSDRHYFLINEKVKDLPGPNRLVWEKYLLLHELSHVILKHPVRPIYNDDASASARNFARMADQNAIYGDQLPEMEAELLACALGFWPQSEFARLIGCGTIKTDFRNIANQFKMPVDCAVKWAAINYHDLFQLHYMKARMQEGETPALEIEDCFIPPGSTIAHKYQMAFECPGTAAFKCRETREDAFSDNAPEFQDGGTEKFYCRAFYERKDCGLFRRADKIVVASFPVRLFETLEMLRPGNK